MRKLIIILLLFLFTFSLNAQVKRTWQLSESYAFTKDKKLHVEVAAVASVGVYTATYWKTKDAGLAFRASWMSTCFGSMLWEGAGMLAGKEVSLGDIGYSTLSAVGTAGIMYLGTKLSEKWKQKRHQKKKDKLIEFLKEQDQFPLVEKHDKDD